MTQSKHTPTPWRMTENKKLGMIKINHTQYCERGETSDIAQILTSLNIETDKANATFIIQCVNNHEALVDTLERLLFLSSTWGYREIPMHDGSEADIAIEDARNALTAAKGDA